MSNRSRTTGRRDQKTTGTESAKADHRPLSRVLSRTSAWRRTSALGNAVTSAKRGRDHKTTDYESQSPVVPSSIVQWSCGPAQALPGCCSHAVSMAQVGSGRVFLRNTKCRFSTIFFCHEDADRYEFLKLLTGETGDDPVAQSALAGGLSGQEMRRFRRPQP